MSTQKSKVTHLFDDLEASTEAQREAVGYIRVSTTEQADSGLSLTTQRERIEAQATANGWRLVGIYEDVGVPAKTLVRPGLQAALKELRPGRVLLALKLDRLTRSVRDLYDLLEAVEASGAAWSTIQDQIDTTTPTGRLIMAVLVDVSQWERHTMEERHAIAKKTQTVMATKRSRGERLGTTPLGYRTVIDGDGQTRVEIDPEEAETVRLAREMRKNGFTLRKIAEHLTAAGRKTKRGGRWQSATVAKLVEPRYLERVLIEETEAHD